jgi:hypothetical protein
MWFVAACFVPVELVSFLEVSSKSRTSDVVGAMEVESVTDSSSCSLVLKCSLCAKQESSLPAGSIRFDFDSNSEICSRPVVNEGDLLGIGERRAAARLAAVIEGDIDDPGVSALRSYSDCVFASLPAWRLGETLRLPPFLLGSVSIIGFGLTGGFAAKARAAPRNAASRTL